MAKISAVVFLGLILCCVNTPNAIAAEKIPLSGAVGDSEIIWISGQLPPLSEEGQKWFWDKDRTQDSVISHTDLKSSGATSHSFTTSSSVRLDNASKVAQYVFVDSEAVPFGIMLKFIFKDSEPVSAYWESDEEAFSGTEGYRTAWYMGYLPKPGKWVKLEIDCEELEIEDKQLIGMGFYTSSGKVWWGRTIISSQ